MCVGTVGGGIANNYTVYVFMGGAEKVIRELPPLKDLVLQQLYQQVI